MLQNDSVTYEKIAEEAGVSYVTVSRAFSNSAPVAAKTQKRIFEIADRLGYRPNYLAKGLRGGCTKSVGIAWSLGGHSCTALTLQKLSKIVHDRGYVVSLIDHEFLACSTKRAMEELLSRGTKILVLETRPELVSDKSIIELLGYFDISIVIARSYCDVPGDLIIHDRYKAHSQVAKHFVTSGRRKPLGLISAADIHFKGKAFLDGFRENGIDVSESVNLLSYNETQYKSIREKQEHIYNMLKSYMFNFKYDCILCNNDETAAIVCKCLQRTGFHIPNDVAVVGADDTPWASLTTPTLASISRKDDELISLVDRIIFERIDNPDMPNRVETIEMKFVWRESAG